MATKAKPIPAGYHSVTPQLVFHDASKAISFYEKVFGAREIARMPGPGGKIWHAELQIGDSRIFLMDAMPGMGAEPPTQDRPSPASIAVYVADVDATFKKLVDGGVKVLRAPTDEFWGDRGAGIIDPFGYGWYVATHIRDVSEEEMRRANEKAVREMESGAGAHA